MIFAVLCLLCFSFAQISVNECSVLEKDDIEALNRNTRGSCTDKCGKDKSKWTCDGACRRAKKLQTCYLFGSIYPNGKRIHVRCCRCHCFPSAARVSLENGNSIKMSELQIGDRVKTVTPGGAVKFSTVRTFMKKDHAVKTTYKSITTSFNSTIQLTGEHLLYTRKIGTDKFNIIYADQVSVGDEVLAQGNDHLTPAKVTNILSFTKQGAFTPVTMDGNIVVDGVLASCYALSDHDLAHIVMTPMRWFPAMMNWIFGVYNGSPSYVNFAEDLGRIMLPFDVMY